MPARVRPRRLTTTKRSKIRIAAECVFKCLGILEYIFYPANNRLQVTRHSLAFDALPKEFDGLRIVQVSDLHGKTFGPGNVRLLDATRAESPDLILVTGDVLDERHFFPDQAREFLKALAELAPVYYIVGNHEADLREEYRDEVFDAVRESGVVFLRDEEIVLPRGDAEILLAGVHDPVFSDPYFETVDMKLQGLDASRMAASESGPRVSPETAALLGLPESASDANASSAEPRPFRLLLSHRPEGFRLYVKHGYDLVFCGHAHGGQFRVPLLFPEGLNAPGQGWLPKYTAGTHTEGRTTMVVSRGLGPSVIPTRLFNRPELVVCELRSSAAEADGTGTGEESEKKV